MKPFEFTKIFIILSLFSLQVYAQSHPQTNLQLYKKMYSRIFELFAAELPDSAESVSLVALDPSSDVNWLAEEQWIKKLNDLELFVHSGDSVSSTRLINIYYRPVRQMVRYQSDGGFAERRIKVDCYVKCTDWRNQVLFAQTFQDSLRDRIPKNRLADVENPLIGYTRAEKPVSRWKRLLEPLLISVISGTIITIFYSYRSK